MKKNISYSLSLLFVCCVLNGCALLENHHPLNPPMDIPEHWNAETITGNTFTKNNNFWEAFNDPQLNQLIAKALLTNNDLAIASLKLKAAKIANDESHIQSFLPDISTNDLSFKSGEWSNTSSTILLNYEIDLFGKLATERSRTSWEMRATQEDRQATALTLIGEVTDLYWDIACYEQKVLIYQNNIADTKKMVDLMHQKLTAGTVARLDVIATEKNLIDLTDSYQTIQSELAKAHRKMAILFNQAPQKLVSIKSASLEKTALPDIQVDIPTNVLANRPDIRSAIYTLNSTLKKAHENPLLNNPILSLSGKLFEILANPMNAWSFATTLVLPKINWQATQQKAKIEYEKNILKYKKAVHTALLELEDILSDRKQLQEKAKTHAESLALAFEKEKIAKARYLAGDTSLEDLLEQQTTKRSEELKSIENRCNQLKNAMQLYRALGGGKFE
ncbi:MAG: TolC family protein [Methylococcales bacterium]|nr:TolC family protein [Methylococcales bacterium]